MKNSTAPRFRRWLSALLVGATTTLFASACASPEEIDRVQPNLIKKADLEGEWYSLSTVLQAPYASHYVFPGAQGSMERGVWEVERNFLTFYRTYEFVRGMDSQGIRSDVDSPLLGKDGKPITYTKVLESGEEVEATRYVYRAAPIKKYSISGHYDVRQSYNPMTGEESNVRIEDSSEKFWYERDYMRVDFGTNVANNFADISFGAALPATMTLYEGDTAPENLRFRHSENYMDFTVRGFVVAPQFFLPGWGFVPSCLFFPSYMGAFFECDEEEITIRSSFMKVEDQDDYEPLTWNDHMLNKFGFFRTIRAVNDENYGPTFSGADRFIQRFDIWGKKVRKDDGTLDYAAMEPKPIVYYLSPKFPRELVRGALDLERQWNDIFLDLVETKMGKAFEVEIEGEKVQGAMFVLCENSQAEYEAALAKDSDAFVAETNAVYCQNMDEPKYLGDLRYNQLYSVNEPVQYGLYGYGPGHGDPITGKTVQANSFMYTANIRLGARRAVDMIEYEAGIQSFRDITDARHIETSMYAKRVKGTEAAPMMGASSDLSRFVAAANAVVPPDVSVRMAGMGVESTDINWAKSRMNRLIGTDKFSHLWLNDDMAALAGMPLHELGQLDSSSAKLLDQIVNPATMATEEMMTWKVEQDRKRGAEAICMADYFDRSIRGLALEYKAKYDAAVCNGLKAASEEDGADLLFDFSAFERPSSRTCSADSDCQSGEVCENVDQGEVAGGFCRVTCNAGALLDQLRTEIRRVNGISPYTYWPPNALYTDAADARVLESQRIARDLVEQLREETFADVYDRMWSTIAMHEAGHNLGLRHNFASSTDALNFFPTFWDLKGDGEGQNWQPYALFETETDTQTKSKMREYQQTSIMEYASAFNARFQGLGAYDRAAIFYGYGRLVEVFEDAPSISEWEDLLKDPSNENPDQFPVETRRVMPLAKALQKVHYTNYPKFFGGVDRMLDRRLVDEMDLVDTSRPCSERDNPYDPSVCGGNSFCQPTTQGFFCTQEDMLEVPYRFCSDEYNFTTPTCQTWDEGVDPYEIIVNSIEDYEAYWPFWGYRRDNELFEPSTTYWGRVVFQMYGYRKQFEHWALDFARYNHNDWWERQYGTPWHLDINGGLGSTLAAQTLFESMANIFGRPSDAFYGYNVKRGAYEPVVDNGANDYVQLFEIREDEGARPVYPSYDFDGYIYVPYRAGTFYDRLAAMQFMAYPTTIFTVGVDRIYDTKRFRLNFASVWPQRVQNLFAGVIAGRPEMYGWCLDGADPSSNSPGAANIVVKPRRYFGQPADLDAYYSECIPLDPEPLYDFPTTQYRLPAMAAIYGFGLMSGTFDRSFIDRNRLWLDGDASDVTIPSGFNTITHVDPFSGKTYVAVYDPTEDDPTQPINVRDIVPNVDFDGHEKTFFWPAARLLVEADERLDVLLQSNSTIDRRRYQEVVGRLEIIRGLYRLFDFGF